jgi:integrase
MNTSETEKDSEWQKTPYANLVRYKSSGIYFARFRVRGKLIRRSLKTSQLSVAKLRLGNLEKQERQRADHQTDEPATASVMQVRECQGAINSACKKVGIARFTHHDLRNLFPTRCIESGVDIPTVSRWLGHKDGGALAMKVYGHLRDQHSVSMARQVSFGSIPATENGMACHV